MASYRELVIRGDEKLLRGFLAGYRVTGKITSGFVSAREHHINTHHLREILTFRGHHVHLLVRRDVHAGLLSALRRVPDDLEFEIVSDRLIRRASFKYEFEIFNRKIAGQIKRTFSRLPHDLKRKGPQHKETIDPSSKGVEAYAPAHDYIYRGKGEIGGELEQLLAYHDKLHEYEFVQVEDIELEF